MPEHIERDSNVTPVQHWIRAKDKLPVGSDGKSICENVIAFTVDGEVVPGWLNGDIWYLLIGRDTMHSKHGRGYVTHWMPMPKSPSGAKMEEKEVNIVPEHIEREGVNIDLRTAIELLEAYKAIGTPEEIKALVEENKRLHEENFWPTGHRGQEEEKPLTLEELREMDGQPVWIDNSDGGVYVIVVVSGSDIYFDRQGRWPASDFVGHIYRRPPKEREDV